MSLSHMYGLSELYDIAVILWLPKSEVSCVFEIPRPVLAKRAFPVDLLIVNLISFGLSFPNSVYPASHIYCYRN